MPPKPARVASAAATVPQPWQILGTRLLPFSLGHHLLFKRMALPFAGNYKADFGKGDLLMGLAVCAAPYDETLVAMLRGEWPQVFSRWKSRLNGPWWRRRRPDLWRAELMFRDYLKDGYALPPLMRRKSDGPGIELTAPWEELLKVRLTMAGFTEAEVMNGYLPGRWYDYYTAIEIRLAERLQHVKDWRRIFYTQELHDQMQSVERGGEP